MPFGLGIGEMLIIFAILLLVFGAKRLPELGGALGRGIREFKTSVRDVQGELNRPADQPQIQRPVAPPPASVEPRDATQSSTAQTINREETRPS